MKNYFNFNKKSLLFLNILNINQNLATENDDDKSRFDTVNKINKNIKPYGILIILIIGIIDKTISIYRFFFIKNDGKQKITNKSTIVQKNDDKW